MILRFRTIDLTPLLVVLAVIVLAVDPPRAEPDVARVPVTGAVAHPCTGEEIVFGGSAYVMVRTDPRATGGFEVHVHADLHEVEATSESGAPIPIGGVVSGRAEATPPFPATLPVESQGAISTRGAGDDVAAELRFPVIVEADGAVSPSGGAEVVALQCRLADGALRYAERS